MRTIFDCLGRSIVAIPKGDGLRFYPSVREYVFCEKFPMSHGEYFDAPHYAWEVAEQMDNLTYIKLKQHITILSKTK